MVGEIAEKTGYLSTFYSVNELLVVKLLDASTHNAEKAASGYANKEKSVEESPLLCV